MPARKAIRANMRAITKLILMNVFSNWRYDLWTWMKMEYKTNAIE